MAFPYIPKVQNLEIKPGTTYTFSGQVLDTTTNLPIDLSGYTASGSFKDVSGAFDVLPSAASSLSISSTTISFVISSSDTDKVNWNLGFYYLYVISPSNIITSVFAGIISLS